MSPPDTAPASRATAMAGDASPYGKAFVATGRTPMTVAVEVWRRERHGEGTSQAAAGRFTLVAMGDDERPRDLISSPPAD